MSTHIGHILETQFLKPNNLSQSDMARAIHVPRARISEIIAGKRVITADTDLRLCRYFGLEDGYFMNLQNTQLLEDAKGDMMRALSEITPLDQQVYCSSEQKLQGPAFRIGLICGGPSPERGISLNSARSVLDHLGYGGIEILPFYVDMDLNFYSISTGQLYSNTPADFDFKLSQVGGVLTQDQAIRQLQEVDLVFPAIHGAFGEDGTLQKFLEDHNIPFVASNSKACKKMFHKAEAAQLLRENGYPTLSSLSLHKGDPENAALITRFFQSHHLTRAIVKPVAGGSSIGVFSVKTPEEALQKLNVLFSMNVGSEAILEPFCKGREFTVIVLENMENQPVALVPNEIQVSYEGDAIFDYRRKYLPTHNTKWPCPPHFEDRVVDQIRHQAQELFTLFGMQDFARLDGWYLEDGRILFTDFNPISGMEQNSFIFQQASKMGMSHRDLLLYIVNHACQRCGITPPQIISAAITQGKQPVRVLFAGATAERQMSLKSGTNAWLKLTHSKKYLPQPYFLDMHDAVWQVPYAYILNHSAEEVHENCLTASSVHARLQQWVPGIRAALGLEGLGLFSENMPTKQSLDAFLESTHKAGAFLFLGLHGGIGEDGRLQQKLDEHKISYNGSGPRASELCMDKYLTGLAVEQMGDPKIITAPKRIIHMGQLEGYTTNDYHSFWTKLVKEWDTTSCIIKPQNDGCSAGIVRLENRMDLEKYVKLVQRKSPYIPPNTFVGQEDPIEMPQDLMVASYILEPFIETDQIFIKNKKLKHISKTGWLELTVGVVERNGVYHSLSPSLTVAEGSVLSLEEKLQGGTGVNITPPPTEVISEEMTNTLKRAIEKTAKALGIENYARLDAFFNLRTGVTMIIEANTLPSLAPSTVIYHQALAEPKSLTPTQFLESLIDAKLGRG